MAIRMTIFAAALGAAALVSACKDKALGPIVVSAIGGAPELRNSNLQPLDPPSAMLVHAVAQGLVRFEAAGQIEPGLAQSWIVSNDGLRYTFRLARTNWKDGRPVTAEQVVARLRAATAAASKNPLKPLLGAIDRVEAMTDNVLEITLKAPRPNFLQLLAQPELGIIRKEEGTGPYRAERQDSGAVLLRLPQEEQEERSGNEIDTDIVLRGDSAALAAARFRRGLSDLVTGGTLGDLPIARAAAPAAGALQFDPVAGLFGLEFASSEGFAADPAVRRALAMAIDRAALVAAFGVPGLQPRETLVPQGVDDFPPPAIPDWAATPLAERRERAARAVQETDVELGRPLRVLVPSGPGYRLVFAHLRRDWRSIGVDAETVQREDQADLRLVDAVAPATIATWYLRRFTCGTSKVCSAEADTLLAAARATQNPAERQTLLGDADRVLSGITPFIPLAAPVRWSLVSPRLTGFQPNPFGRRFIGGLVEQRR
jgi:peptide/nickel transport system substrate-binding protein